LLDFLVRFTDPVLIWRRVVLLPRSFGCPG
jgi:hypothetical protein